MLKQQILATVTSSTKNLLQKKIRSPAAKEYLFIVSKRQYAAESGKKQSLVILGAGWGGFRLIKAIDLEKYEVSVVTPRNHFLFTPLLPSAASGTLEFRSIIEPIRKARHDPDYHYYEASCTRIDTEKQVVECAPNHPSDAHFELKYDKLVVAVGCDVNTMGVKGVNEHAFFLKEVKDARRIRNKIIECFERASNPNTPVSLRERLLHFIIVGAGPTGVEAAAEFHDLINQDLKYNFPEHLHLDIKITILEAGKQILSAFDKSLQKYTQKFFYRKGVQIYMGTKVKEVKDENLVVLDDGSEIECGLVLWSAGIQARGIIMDKSKHTLPVDEKFHKVIVDEYLRIQGTKNAFAMGDCSLIAPKPLPATAQVAQQQGYYLAKLFNKYDSETIASAGSTAAAVAKATAPSTTTAGESAETQQAVQAAKDAIVPPFVYEHQGLMAYIGDFHAVTEIKAGQSRWFRLHGYVSWFLYRSAYLTKLVSWKNKLLVPVDWAKSIVFGRDISKF